jgi:hypothetical protein
LLCPLRADRSFGWDAGLPQPPREEMAEVVPARLSMGGPPAGL